MPPPNRRVDVMAIWRRCAEVDIRTTTELAIRSGIERSHLTRMLEDTRSVKTHHVVALAQALDCQPVDILDPSDPFAEAS